MPKTRFYISFLLFLGIFFLLPASMEAQVWRDARCSQSVLASGRWVKVRVPETGVYRLTDAELRKMGFSQPDRVRVFGYGGYRLSTVFSSLPAADLPAAPMMYADGALLFYGRGSVEWLADGTSSHFMRNRNESSDYGYYFLTDREDLAGGGMETDAGLDGEAELMLDAFQEHVLHEQDAYSWSSTGRDLYEGYDYVQGASRDYAFRLPGRVAGTSGWLEARFAARSVDVATAFSVSVDGTQVGRASLAAIPSESQFYSKAKQARVTAEWSGGESEDVVVTVSHERPSGISGRLDYIVLNYVRRLDLSSLPYLCFRSLQSVGKATEFRISGASASTVVWDVTEPWAPRQMVGTVDEAGVFSFTIPAGSLRQFVAINPTASGFAGVETVGTVINQNLHGLEQADMVIICPDRRDLQAQAERLAQAHRDRDGLAVSVVTASQIYNEFSSGTPEASAYRRLMKMLYDRAAEGASPAPRYLLLFGDCSFDNRMLTASWSKYKAEDFLLSFQSDESLEEITSYITDDYFGFLDDDEGSSLSRDRLDIGIGRFPVRTEAEARTAVDKTLAYMENKEAGAWKNSVCYVADDGDNNLHVSQAEALASYVEENYSSLRVNRVYADAYRRESSATGYSYPDAHKQLLRLLEQGLLVVNYSGHGSTTAWSAENLLTMGDIQSLSSPRLPLWITATCDFTRFDDVQTSAGEAAFLNEKGGAIALLTTSRVVDALQNSTLNQAFMRHIFSRPDGQRLRLGDIMRISKADDALATDQNKLNFVLIGDPALTLAYPELQVRIEEFGGVDVMDEDAPWPQVKAGGRITVKGCVLTEDGNLAEDFDGLLSSTVYDSSEEVSTLDNLGEGAFIYTERSKILYQGTDSVKGGRFEFTFPVPLDINYSDESGLLNLYALDEARREAGGAFGRFTVGGTDDGVSQSDTLGPEIRIYLNTPDYEPGDKTNETPLFVAEIADEDGINTVGNGVGHDLSLCIDSSPVLTYNLNDYYVSASGDYTRGTVRFSIPELTEGRHVLTFRAWDLLNHSSVATLEFEVVRGLQPGLLSVRCSRSPARESTRFLLQHNRPGSTLGVRLSVYDLSGRELWTHTEQGISSGETYEVEWNLCSNAGQRLAPGVYLYRASIVSGGSSESVKAQKILILAQ